MSTTTPLSVQQIGIYTIVEIRTPSLMDPPELESLGEQLYRLVDEQDKRMLILDFERVQYLSSQAIGILLTLHKKLAALSKSRLILCGVNSRLTELLKITRLDRVLTVTPTQAEAVKIK